MEGGRGEGRGRKWNGFGGVSECYVRKMEEARIEGSDQPGTRRSSRRDRRGTDGGAEIGLGNDDVAIPGKRLRMAALTGVKRICVWPRDPVSIQRMWEIVGETLKDRARKIGRIRQRSGVTRFDVYVPEEYVARACRKLKRVGIAQYWYVRRHRKYSRRPLRVSARRQESGGEGVSDVERHPRGNEIQEDRSLGATVQGDIWAESAVPPPNLEMTTRVAKVATWNIRSLTQKRVELEMYMQRNGIQILGLQETWRDRSQWPLRLKGYHVLEAEALRGVESRNGLALLVSSTLPMYQVCGCSPYAIGARVRVGMEEWTILNVYVPVIGVPRQTALKFIRAAIEQEVVRNLSAKLLVMGDWNMDVMKLSRMLGRWRVPMSVIPCNGNPATYRGPTSWSSIDHMVVSSEGSQFVKKCRVNRTWDLSDHWPLESALRGVSVVEETTRVRPRLSVDVPVLLGNREAVLGSNRWAVLGELLDREEEFDLPAVFESTVRDVVEDIDAVRAPDSDSKGPSYRLSHKAKAAIAKRRKAYAAWLRNGAPSLHCESWGEYLRTKQLSDKERRASSTASWLRFVSRGAESLALSDMKGFWKWAKLVLHRGKSGPADYGPLLMETGNETRMAYSPTEKLEQWRSHYQSLLGDVTGHSRDPQYWEEKLPGPAAASLGLNGAITWVELNRVLRKMRAGTAPGCDGIPTEFYRLAIGVQESVVPDSLFGSILLRVCNWLLDKGEIPGTWNEAWVVSIFKKGDPKNMDNYRGISLLVVLVKLVTLVITIRLRDALENQNFFIRQQAGFRTFEECAGHVCSLYEILVRRQIMGAQTFVAFIDFKKAYDTVPIECLLRKLSLVGVDGKALAFFRALYANATVRVRTRYGLSDVVSLLRGLRQGCNASPLLFDIFINDILDDCAKYGVRVMGLPAERREVGLLFADDLVLVCGSVRKLRGALRRIQKWSSLYEMQFGVSKCGIMGFGEGACELLREEHHRLVLDGQPIPLVSQYDYLGVLFTETLDLGAMADARAEKGQKCLHSLRPVLGCASIPIAVRVRILKAILIPVLTYGSEVWGMQTVRVQKGQMVLSEALRLLVRLKAKCTITSSATLGLEFGIDPLYAIVSALRARAFVKFPTLRTTIADLMAAPPVSRKQSWVSGTRRWLQRFCPAALVAGRSPREVGSLVRDFLRERAIQVSVTAVRYRDGALERTRQYLGLGSRYPGLARGIHWLCRLRVNAFWTAVALQRIGWLPPRYRTECPFCHSMGTGETIEHMLMDCPRWAVTRAECFGEWVETLHGVAINLLGGSRVESGVSPTEIESLWLGNVVAQEGLELGGAPQLMGNNDADTATPGFTRVARFLQIVLPVRFRALSVLLLQAPRADADISGMAVLAEEAEVNGGLEETPVAEASEVDTRWETAAIT